MKKRRDYSLRLGVTKGTHQSLPCPVPAPLPLPPRAGKGASSTAGNRESPPRPCSIRTEERHTHSWGAAGKTIAPSWGQSPNSGLAQLNKLLPHSWNKDLYFPKTYEVYYSFDIYFHIQSLPRLCTGFYSHSFWYSLAEREIHPQ